MSPTSRTGGPSRSDEELGVPKREVPKGSRGTRGPEWSESDVNETVEERKRLTAESEYCGGVSSFRTLFTDVESVRSKFWT